MIDDKTLNFLSYINKPMNRESILLIYSANNINYEKCELYNDFIKSLMDLIFETYLGDDITDSIQQINHFNCCWNKTIDNFKEDGILLGDKKLYNYFLEFIMEVYYPIKNKDENKNAQHNIVKLWSYIFDYNNNKSQSDIETLIEVYKMFENSIKIS